MSISNLSWRDALRVVRVGRKIANPNSGFQIQLQDFENSRLDEERRRMKERFPSLALRDVDQEYIYRALEHFETLVASRDLCHFNCKRNENCPTGMQIFNAPRFVPSYGSLLVRCSNACYPLNHKRDFNLFLDDFFR